MTNTTPTPCALDLNKLPRYGFCDEGIDFDERPDGGYVQLSHVREALARRASQPYDSNEFGHLLNSLSGDAYEAAELAFEMGKHAAQPSAEKAAEGELPPLPKPPCLLPGVYAYRESHMINYARDAIAASRRAAGGEDVYQVELDAKLGTWMDVAASEVPTWERKKFKVRVLATPAPESAAQAESATKEEIDWDSYLVEQRAGWASGGA